MELIGRKIAGKFVVESEIGRGGMGTVFRARQIDLEKEVAIKVLKEGLGDEQEFASRFKREAKAASKIDHPNSMRVIDFGQEPDGLLYIAMELLDGKSLHDIIKEEAPLETGRIADLTRQTLAALAAAHDLGILHRDLKPENIIVVRKRTDDGHEREIVKVCDFGIAKVSFGSSVTPDASKLTSAGSIVGTPDYMSPEQARGTAELDSRTDLYSVGVMMYQMMARRLPFEAQTPLGVVLMHLNEQPKPPSEHVPTVDRRLEAICLRAMAKNPKDRFESARDMRSALSFAEGESGPSLPGAPTSKRKLLLMPPEASVVQETNTAMAAPKTRPMRSSPSAKEMLAAPELPTRSLTPTLIVIAALVLVGGGAFYFTRPHPPVTPTVEPPLPSQKPSAMPHASAPIAIVSAMAPKTSTDAALVPSVAASASAKPSAWIAPSVASSHAVASIVPSATASAPPPLPPSPLHVIIGAVSAEHVSPSGVKDALPVARFERCYRDGVTGQAKVPVGSAKLHITMTASSTEATFAGPPELAAIGTCVVGAANKIAIDIPSGGATADIDLAFKTD